MANRRAYRPDRHVYRRLRMNTVGRRRRWTWVLVGIAIIVALFITAVLLRWVLRG
ncbi:MAG TPA: hypothetical protein VF624_19395 [Tepidisphaeraceae bacterium]|jgi:hypothetical protein